MIIFQDMFMESRGKPIEYNGRTVQMVDKVSIGDGADVRIRFELISAKWKQGINLTTNGHFVVNGDRFDKSIVLWQDTAPVTSEFRVNSSDGLLSVKNVWDMGDGVMQSWRGGGAMMVEGDAESRRDLCNDGEFDDDFDDLIFTLEIGQPSNFTQRADGNSQAVIYPALRLVSGALPPVVEWGSRPWSKAPTGLGRCPLRAAFLTLAI